MLNTPNRFFEALGCMGRSPSLVECQDFALRLCYILIGNRGVQRRLSSLAASFHLQIVHRVLRLRTESTLRHVQGGVCSVAVGFGVALIAATLFPPAAMFEPLSCGRAWWDGEVAYLERAYTKLPTTCGLLNGSQTCLNWRRSLRLRRFSPPSTISKGWL
jgi:hypothetical protein